MALTGLDIYKKLPKDNCKECGVPTCLAFAMKVAAGQATLDQCPRLSDEAQQVLIRDGNVETAEKTLRHDFRNPDGSYDSRVEYVFVSPDAISYFSIRR